jgi:tetratricopeptide (TPR) repeat protein
MLKVFLSSSFRDLQDERDELIKQISPALDVFNLERFIPDGRQSQAVSIENLRGSDVAVFLISPYYGTLLEPGPCPVSDCKTKDCPHRNISYTHCEYRFAVAENKPRIVYLVEPVTRKPELAQMYAYAEGLYNAFKKEIQQVEMAPEVHEINTDRYDQIASGLVANIVRWYEEDRIKIKDFYGRGRELRELMEKIGKGNERVLVHGAGGIGKTTMIQVALLMQAMRGKKIFAIGPSQSYLSSSGYSYFRSSDVVIRQESQQPETISLYDLAEAFKVPEDILKAGKEELMKCLLVRLKERDRLTFIDDFHLADPVVKELVQQVDGSIIMAGKKDLQLGQQRIELGAVAEEKRVDMVRGIASRLGKPVDDQTIGKIAAISEGYPVVMEILVNNYQNENFDDVQRALQSEESTGEEFLQRAVKSVLSPGALEILQQIAIINPDLGTNLDYHALWYTFPKQNIEELIRKSLLAKREGDSDRYRITYQSVQQIIAAGIEDDGSCNEMAVSYYQNKLKPDGKVSPDDQVEMLHHQLKGSFDPAMVNRIDELYEELNPQDYGYRRLAAVCEELIPHLDEANRASVLGASGNLYSGLRIYGEAEGAYLAALEIRQKLDAQNPGAYSSDLAMTQSHLGVLYSNTGRYGDAERAYLAALEIYEKLDAQNPGAYIRDLARAQNYLGVLYSNTGRHAEAERAYLAALEIYEKLDAQNPGAHSSDLARTQSNLGAMYSNTGRYGDAERAYLAALEIYEKLDAQNPGAYNRDLARTQRNLGVSYSNTGRHEKAEQAYLTALEIYEKLVAKNPGAYSSELAMTQNYLGVLYSNTGRHEKAERAYLAALEVRQTLADQNPGAYNRDLAKTQNNLAVVYFKTGRHGEAEQALLAALEIRQKLADQNPGAYSSELAMTQSNLGDLYSNTGRYGDAERAYLAALEIYEKLDAQNPGAYNRDLARVQNNLGAVHGITGRHVDAERAYLAALEIRQKLADQNPGTHSSDLAMTQSHLGVLYSKTGRYEKAERACLATLEIYEKLVAKNPVAHSSNLAKAQSNLGAIYRIAGRHGDAAQNPEACLSDLAMTQQNLGVSYRITRRYRDAEQAYLIALEIYEKLATKYPEAYNQYVQTVKDNLKELRQ